MEWLYKKILVEKLSSFVCDIRYKSGDYAFEKPFRLATKTSPETLMAASSVNVIDLIDNTPKTLNFSDIQTFSVKETLTEDELKARLDRYQDLFSVFKYLGGKALYDLFFCVTYEDNCYDRLRHMRMMDALKLSTLDDYTRLRNNDRKIVDALRDVWYQLIVEKYQQTIKALDDEKATTNDESINSELTTIAEILKTAPEDAKEELKRRTTVESIIEYWPTLLLPRSTVFWVDKKVNVT